MADFELITSLVTPASDYDLTTRDVAKAELGVTDTLQDAAIDGWITRASAAVANYCNRVFVLETVKDEFWPRRDPRVGYDLGRLDPLQLSRYPAVAIISVVEDGTTLVDGTDFRSNLVRGQLIRLDTNLYPRRWPVLPIAVTYSAGFGTIPGDIVDAVLRLVTARKLARGRDPFLREQNIPGVLEQQWWVAQPGEEGNLPPDVIGLLGSYRVPVIA